MCMVAKHCFSRAAHPCPLRNLPQTRNNHSYEDFTRLAETRLAQNSVDYIKLVLITLTYVEIH